MYRVRVKEGASTRWVRIAAGSPKAAMANASRYGKPLQVKTDWAAQLGPGMKPNERLIFLRKLANMSQSKLPISRALEIIRDSFGGRISQAASELVELINTGTSLGEAMEASRKHFPSKTVALVKAGLQSGDTPSALKAAAEFDAAIAATRKMSSGGLWSSILSIFLAAGVVAGGEFVIRPLMAGFPMFDTTTPNMLMVGTASLIVLWSMSFLSAGIGGLIFLGYVLRRMAPSAADAVILKIPVFRDLVLAISNFITLQNLSQMIRAGVRIERALELIIETSPKGALKKDIERALHHVRHGLPWSAAMHTLHPTDRASLAAAVDRADIAENLKIVAEGQRDIYADRIRTVVPALKIIGVFYLVAAAILLSAQYLVPVLEFMDKANAL